MTQNELDRELSRVTGESVATIKSRGFSLIEPEDQQPLSIDWDELDAVELPRRYHRRLAMAA
jgi:hypothetical protein